VLTFVHIKKIEDFDFQEAEYFSLYYENNDNSVFDIFLEKHIDMQEIEAEFGDLMAWIEKLGNEGTEARFFRHEKKADALPPNLKYLDFEYEKQLRLYCLRLSDRAVILFGGGIKTTDKAQDCKNVATHFYEAQQFCKHLNELIRNKEVYIDIETQQLIIDTEGFYL